MIDPKSFYQNLVLLVIMFRIFWLKYLIFNIINFCIYNFFHWYSIKDLNIFDKIVYNSSDFKYFEWILIQLYIIHLK